MRRENATVLRFDKKVKYNSNRETEADSTLERGDGETNTMSEKAEKCPPWEFKTYFLKQ